MKVLNFSHPLSDVASAQIQEKLGQFETLRIPVQVDPKKAMEPQVEVIMAEVGFTPDQWQTEAYALVLPGLTGVAGILLAKVHGRAGHFPRIILLRQNDEKAFEVGEIVDLQDVRNEARKRR